jgi:hypothetical protein
VDIVAKLEALAAEPKPFVCVAYWRHADGTLERKPWAPMPRRAMAESRERHLRQFIGKPQKTQTGFTVTLERVEVIDERESI